MAGPRRRTSGRSPPARPAPGRVPAAATRRATSPRIRRASACSTRISMTLPGPAPFLGGQEETFQQLDRLVESGLVALGRVLGQQHPGQGDVLELAQVAEVVRGGQSPLTHPARPLRSSLPCAIQHARPDGRDRTHVRREVRRVQHVPPRPAGRGRRRGLPRPHGREPSRSASDAGSAAARCARPAPRPAPAAAWRARGRCARGGARHPDVHVGGAPQDRPVRARARRCRACS